MMTAIWMFLAAVCVLGPLVALHEFGHYIVARLCGVKVLTYSIGFGPRLVSWTSRRSQIEYRISAIPLGGYVKMLDEAEAAVSEADKPRAFNRQHPLKKIAIVAAGPVMNFIIAIVLFAVLFLIPSEQLNTRIGQILPNSPAAASALAIGDKIERIDGKAVQTWEQVGFALVDKMGETTNIDIQTTDHAGNPKHIAVPVVHFMQSDDGKQRDPVESLGALPFRPIVPPVIGEVVADSAADLMGLKTGDTIQAIRVDTQTTLIDDWQVASKIIRENPEKMLEFSVLREGKQLQIGVMPRGVKTAQGIIGQIGVRVDFDANSAIPSEYRTQIQHTPSEAIQKAVGKTYDLSVMTLKSMGKMITGMIGLENLSGPISIAEVSKASFEIGWQQVLSTAALISLSLAVLNLLPIPVLDGGHLLFYLYELIVGKSVPEKLKLGALRFGLALLLCCMVLAIGNDMMRLFG